MRVVHHAAPPAQLDRASTAAAGLESAAFCAGPALGGFLLLVVTDAAGSLLVCAAMMLISAGLASSLRTVSRATTQCDRLPDQRIRTAGRCLLDSRIRPAVVAVLGVNVIAGLDAALLVRLPGALRLADERSFGLMSLAHGAGAVVAFFALVGPIPRCRRPLLPLIMASAAVVVLGATDELSVAVVACFAIGASILTSEAVVTSALGRALPAPLVAPAFGVLDAWMVAAMVAGAALAPLLTVTVGLQPTLVFTGLGIPFLAIGALIGARSDLMIGRPGGEGDARETDRTSRTGRPRRGGPGGPGARRPVRAVRQSRQRGQHAGVPIGGSRRRRVLAVLLGRPSRDGVQVSAQHRHVRTGTGTRRRVSRRRPGA